MAVAAPRKPKRVVEAQDALSTPPPQETPTHEVRLQHDPVLRDLLQTARPECTPTAPVLKQKFEDDDLRRRREAMIKSETNGQNGQWAFVKNMSPKELITLEDGTTFTFPNNLYICRDEEMAKKLIAVSAKYNIVLK